MMIKYLFPINLINYPNYPNYPKYFMNIIVQILS